MYRCNVCAKPLDMTDIGLCRECMMSVEQKSARRTGKPPAHMDREELAGLSQIDKVLAEDSARMGKQAARRKASQARTEEPKDE